MTFEDAAVHEARQRHVLVHEEDERVVRAHRHQVDHPLAHAVDVVEAGTVEAERHAGPRECLVHRVELSRPQRHAVHRVRPDDAGDESECLRAVYFARRGLRIVGRDHRGADQALGIRRGPVGDPVVPHLVRRDREVDVGEASEGLAEPAVEHRDVDPLGVHHRQSLLRIPAPGVEVVGVPQRVAEVLVLVHPGVAETGEPHRDRDVVLDQHVLRPDLVRVADPRAPLAHRRRELGLPEVDRLADVAVGVDHDVLAAARELDHVGPLVTRPRSWRTFGGSDS